RPVSASTPPPPKRSGSSRRRGSGLRARLLGLPNSRQAATGRGRCSLHRPSAGPLPRCAREDKLAMGSAFPPLPRSGGGGGPCEAWWRGWRRQSGGGVLGEAALRRAQPLDRPLDLAALALQVADLGDDLLRIELILEIRRFARPLAADQILDFGEGEAKLLALEDHLHPHAVGRPIIPSVAFPARLDEPAILIEPERAQADAKQARHLADGDLRLRRIELNPGFFFEQRARNTSGRLRSRRQSVH